MYEEPRENSLNNINQFNLRMRNSNIDDSDKK